MSLSLHSSEKEFSSTPLPAERGEGARRAGEGRQTRRAFRRFYTPSSSRRVAAYAAPTGATGV